MAESVTVTMRAAPPRRRESRLWEGTCTPHWRLRTHTSTVSSTRKPMVQLTACHRVSPESSTTSGTIMSAAGRPPTMPGQREVTARKSATIMKIAKVRAMINSIPEVEATGAALVLMLSMPCSKTCTRWVTEPPVGMMPRGAVCAANIGVMSTSTASICRGMTGAEFHPVSRYSADTAVAETMSTTAGTHQPSPRTSVPNKGRDMSRQNRVARGSSALITGPPGAGVVPSPRAGRRSRVSTGVAVRRCRRR